MSTTTITIALPSIAHAHVRGVIITSDTVTSTPPQLPVSAVLMQIHSGEAAAPQADHFYSSVVPTLLSYVWSMKHPSKLWVAYKMARRASMMVRSSILVWHACTCLC